MGFMDLTLLGQAFSDYKLSNVGASAYQLEHDFFTKEDLLITTASGGGGTPLSLGVDYQLLEEDEELSQRVTHAVGATRTVYHKVQVINATYQAGDLYHNGKYIADSNSAEDMEYRKVKAVNNADYTVRDADGFGVIAVDPSGAWRTVTLPTVADNANRELTIVNIGTGTNAIVVDGEGTEKINDVETWNLFAGQSITIKSNSTKWVKTAGHLPILHVRDEKASGTGGGTATASAWYKRDLNTVKLNEIAGASLASNEIILPAGTYFIRARMPMTDAEYFKAKLYNITDTVDLIIGSNARAASGFGAMLDSWAIGQFTLSAGKHIGIYYYCTTGGANRLGSPVSSGSVEVYTEVEIQKVI